MKKTLQMPTNCGIIPNSDIPTLCYKIVDKVFIDDLIGKRFIYKFLFHGVNRSRDIPFEKWIKAERKWAGEGGTKYWTGFHVLLTKEACEKYLGRFTDENKTRVIVKGYARGLRAKESSKDGVFLAEELFIFSQQEQ